MFWDFKWDRSSIWSERFPVTEEAAGSSPVGPASIIDMKNSAETIDYKNLILETVRNRYPYFLIGLTIFIILASFLVSFIKLPAVRISQRSTEQNKPESSEKKAPRTHVVKEGEHLWKIAEEAYGSGYNAYDIALANNITNPGLIYLGQVLVLPSLTPKESTTGEVVAAATTEKVEKKINTYVVKEGDYLWKIAEEAYGDGYAWPKIAKANNITNPDFIFKETTLIIP